MNKIYKVVFNKVLGVFTAVSELAGHKGKKSAKAVMVSVMAGLVLASVSTGAVAQEVGATPVDADNKIEKTIQELVDEAKAEGGKRCYRPYEYECHYLY